MNIQLEINNIFLRKMFNCIFITNKNIIRKYTCDARLMIDHNVAQKKENWYEDQVTTF